MDDSITVLRGYGIMALSDGVCGCGCVCGGGGGTELFQAKTKYPRPLPTTFTLGH